MADNRTKRGYRDRSRIDVSEDCGVRYWTDRLGVSKSQLEEAVREVGPMAEAVETELRRKTLAAGP